MIICRAKHGWVRGRTLPRRGLGRAPNGSLRAVALKFFLRSKKAAQQRATGEEKEFEEKRSFASYCRTQPSGEVWRSTESNCLACLSFSAACGYFKTRLMVSPHTLTELRFILKKFVRVYATLLCGKTRLYCALVTLLFSQNNRQLTTILYYTKRILHIKPLLNQANLGKFHYYFSVIVSDQKIP